LPQVESVLPVMVAGKLPLCLYIKLWAFQPYFLPCPLEVGNERVAGSQTRSAHHRYFDVGLSNVLILHQNMSVVSAVGTKSVRVLRLHSKQHKRKMKILILLNCFGVRDHKGTCPWLVWLQTA